MLAVASFFSNGLLHVATDASDAIAITIAGDGSVLVNGQSPSSQPVSASEVQRLQIFGSELDNDISIQAVDPVFPNLKSLRVDSGAGDDDVQIGLLLPAAQKVRDAFDLKVQLGDGNNSASLQVESRKTHTDIQVLSGSGNDDVVIGLLVPAVQKVRESAARLNVQLGDGDDRLVMNVEALAGEESEAARSTLVTNVRLGEGNNRAEFKYTSEAARTSLNILSGSGDDDIAIGLLTPAVQKVRESAARLNVQLGDGDNHLALNVRALGSEELEQKVRSKVLANICLGDGDDFADVQFESEATSNTLNLAAGDGANQILVGFLLPAIQKVRDSAARMNVQLGDGDDQLAMNVRALAGEDAEQKVRSSLIANVRLGGGENVADIDMESEALHTDLNILSLGGNDDVSIGLLLPAEQKVRDSAARLNVQLGDGDNHLLLNVEALAGETAELKQRSALTANVRLGGGNNFVDIKCISEWTHTDINVLSESGDDDVSIGLLLPAEQKVRDSAARMNVQLGDGDDLLVLDVQALGSAEVEQKVRSTLVTDVRLGEGNNVAELTYYSEATRTDINVLSGAGNDDVAIGLLVPAVQKIVNTSAKVHARLGDGEDLFRLNVGADRSSAGSAPPRVNDRNTPEWRLRIHVDAGAGDDQAQVTIDLSEELRAQVFATLFGNEGDDDLALFSSAPPHVKDGLLINGGDGLDTCEHSDDVLAINCEDATDGSVPQDPGKVSAAARRRR